MPDYCHQLTCQEMLDRDTESASLSPAVGSMFQVDGVAPGAGLQFAYNVMFFPESCEISGYLVLAGAADMARKAIKGESFEHDDLIKIMPFGFSAGATATVVIAEPVGQNTHDSQSWTGYFKSGSGSLLLGAAGAFWSDDWAGIEFGGAAGAPAGAVFSFQHYSLKHTKKVECRTCIALRTALTVDPVATARRVGEIFKTIGQIISE